MFKQKSTIDLVRPELESDDVTETPEKPSKERRPKGRAKERAKERPKEIPEEASKEITKDVSKKKDKKEPVYFKDYFRNKTFLGGICVIAALIIAFGVVPMMQKVMTTDTATAVVLNQDVKSGAIITKEMVTTKEMRTNDIPDGAAGSVDQVVGKYVKVAALKADVVTQSRLSSTYPGDDPELAALPNGKVAIALSLDTLAQSVSGKLRAGDVIQLFAVYKDTSSKGTAANAAAATAIPELQYVEVLSVSDADANDISDQPSGSNDTQNTAGQSKEPKKISTITIAANEAQAKAVAGLQASATIHAALVSRGDDSKKSALLTAQDNYFAPADNTATSAGTGTTSASGSQVG